MTTVPIREQVSDIDLELSINRWLTEYLDVAQRKRVARVLVHFLLSINFLARIGEDGFLQIVRAYNVHILFEDITAFSEAEAKRKTLNMIHLETSCANIIVEGVTPYEHNDN